MPFAIAVLVVAALSFASLKLRAYMCFGMVMFGIAALIAGPLRDESIITFGGVFFLVGGLLILFLSSLKVEKSRRLIYMLHLFIYGMFMMVRLMMIMAIILIPFTGIVGGMCKEWHERVLVDEAGRGIGKVYVDDNGMGADGKKYEKFDRPF